MTADGRLRRLVGHSATYVAGTALQSGLSLLLLPVVTRVLSVEQYGIVAVASAVAALLAIVFGLGLNVAIVRFHHEGPGDAGPAGAVALLRAQAAVALALAAIVFAAGPLWGGAVPDVGWHGALQLAVVLGLGSSVQGTAQGVLRAAGRPAAFLAVTAVQAVGGTAAGIALAVDGGAAGYVGGMALGSGAAALLAVGLVHRPARLTRSLLTGGLALALPFLAHQIATWGMSLADRLLLAFFVTTAELGRYQVAYFAGTVLVLVLAGVQAAWAPFYLAQLGEHERREAPARLVLPATALVAAATVVLVAVAPVMLPLLVPDAFGGTAIVIALVAAATIPRAAYVVAVPALLDRRRSGVMASSSALAVAVTVGLDLALIPVLGIAAAGVALLCASAVQAAAILVRVERMLERDLRLPALLATWTGAAGLLAGLAELPDAPLGSALRGVALAAAVAVAIAAARRLRAALGDAGAPAPAGVTTTPA